MSTSRAHYVGVTCTRAQRLWPDLAGNGSSMSADQGRTCVLTHSEAWEPPAMPSPCLLLGAVLVHRSGAPSTSLMEP